MLSAAKFRITGSQRARDPILVGDPSGDAQPARHTSEARFLIAWREAVMLIGVQLFGTGRIVEVASVTSKWDLAPRLQSMRSCVGAMECPDRMFLCAVLSLYNPQEAIRLRQLCGLTTFFDRDVLDPVRQELVSELLLNSTGW